MAKTFVIRRGTSRPHTSARRTKIVKRPAGQSLYLFDYRTRAQLPKLGLCKIRTERFRDMPTEQLEQAEFFLGSASQKERISRSNPRGLLWRFIHNLLGSRRNEELNEQAHKAYVRTYGEEPMPAEQIRQGYEREADHIEKQIWDAQQKKGCKIAAEDSPARDYIRSEGKDQRIIDAARGRRKAKIR